MLNNCKSNGEIELTPVYFNSTIKLNSVFKMIFKKFCTVLTTGLMKDLAAFLN